MKHPSLGRLDLAPTLRDGRHGQVRNGSIMAAGAAIGAAVPGRDQPVADRICVVVRTDHDVMWVAVAVAPDGRAVAQEQETVRGRLITQSEGADGAYPHLEMVEPLAVGARIRRHGQATRL